MSLPYFPLFPDDFEADTPHLTMLEDGAYNRLLRLCWRSPRCQVPADEAWLFRKLRARSDDEQAAVRAIVEEYFDAKGGMLTNPKLLKIWNESNASYERRAKAGSKGGRAKSLKNNDVASSNTTAMLKQPEPEPYRDTLVTEGKPSVPNGAEAPNPDKVMFDAGVKLLTSAGSKPSQARSILGKWRKLHGAEAVIAALGKAQREGAIEPIGFIEGCFRQRRQSAGAEDASWWWGGKDLT